MIAFIVGKGLSGKSYYVKGFLARSKKPFIVLDPMMEYTVDARFLSMESFQNAVTEKRIDGNVGLTFPTMEEGFEFFAWSYNLDPHILVIEEFHLYANAWSISKPLQRLLRMGRHQHIDIIGITHRFVDLPQIVVTQCQALVLFRQQGIHDINAISKVTNPDVAAQVMALRDHEKVEYRF